MARLRQTTQPAPAGRRVLRVEIDPLAVPRGVRVLPPCQVHASARRPARARAKREALRWAAE